ncbi:MAG: hypothetical protein M1281_16875 [Chloroflexi bacterium]|nr:hypothetical protein [Chloroflexota bacterium]
MPRLRSVHFFPIILLLLAACAPASSPEAAIPSTLAPSPISATETPTVVWFPPTETPTLAPTQALTPTPDPRGDLGKILLSDDFSKREHWQTGRTPAGSMAFGDSEFTLAVAEPKASLSSLRDGPVLTDFYVEVNAEPSMCRGADAYGVLLRAASEADFYRFTLTCDDRMRFERTVNNQTAVIQDWTPRLGPPAPSRLGVWVTGTEMRFFVDGIYQFSAHDPVLHEGRLGLFARSAGDTPLTVNFSNLVVYQASAPSASTTPSPTP